MKVRLHVRVARDDYARKRKRVAAGLVYNPAPLTDTRGDALPTIAFALDLDVPDSLFGPSLIAELTIPPSAVRIAAAVVDEASA